MNRKHQILALLDIASSLISDAGSEQHGSEAGDKLDALLEKVSDIYRQVDYLKFV